MSVHLDQAQVIAGDESFRFSLADLQNCLSLSRGWEKSQWQDQKSLRLIYGGNEVRFGVQETSKVQISVVTEAYVWIQVLVNQSVIVKIAPESDPARISIPLDPDRKNDISLIRSSVSSGPFYVDAHLLDIEIEPGGRILPPEKPVPETCFCTFGDSISGNSLIGADQPFDPYEVGYGWLLCRRFGFQYLNPARDGSGLCCRLFENPLARERVEREVIAHNPDYLLILYGTNDLAGGADPEKEFAPAYRELLQTLKQGLPETKIACSALLWRSDFTLDQVTTFSRIILDTCQEMSLPCCDPFDWLGEEDFKDGLHPNPQGHQTLAAKFGSFLEDSFPELKHTKQE